MPPKGFQLRSLLGTFSAINGILEDSSCQFYTLLQAFPSKLRGGQKIYNVNDLSDVSEACPAICTTFQRAFANLIK